jgi:hypothetical protein
MAQLGLTNFHYFNGFRILTAAEGIQTVLSCLRSPLRSKEACWPIRYIQDRLLGAESGARAVTQGLARPVLPAFLLVEEA